MAKHYPYSMDDIWSLGRLISALERANPTHSVFIDWNMLRPTGVCSYRGYYSDLSVEFELEGAAPSVADFLKWLTSARGNVFEGYKGGLFMMADGTPVWVANYGESGGVAIVGAVVPNRSDKYGNVILLTGICDDIYQTEPTTDPIDSEGK